MSISLVLAAALSIVWVVLQPSPGDKVDGGSADVFATLSACVFTLSQLPFILGLMGAAHNLAAQAPMWAGLGGGFTVLDGFGHAVLGGVQLTQIGAGAAAVPMSALPGPLSLLTLLVTVGTVPGLILLAVGLLRAKVGPRWVPYARWVFVLVEFGVSNFTAWASMASGMLYLASFVALAVTIWQTLLGLWRAEG